MSLRTYTLLDNTCPLAGSMKVLKATGLQRNQECEALRMAFPMGKMKNLFFLPSRKLGAGSD